MARPESDRNLLFGILALQMDLVTRDHLVAAMNAWVLRKQDSLASVLVEQGALEPRDRDLIEPMVARHLERHGGDPERSLAAAAGRLGTPLRGMVNDDPDVVAALETLAPSISTTAPGGDLDAAPVQPSPHRAGDRYRVLKEHAKGGLGIVFLAQDTELNRRVALKEIQRPYADDEESRARFLIEAEVTGNLEHPGVVPVYGLGRHQDGRPFYAMRFIKGDSLKDAIAHFHRADRDAQRDPGERALSLQKLLRRFLDVCNAIQYAHDRGILHRDLKPGNVMVGKYGETLVVDWGLAKFTGRPEGVSSVLEETTLRPSGSGGTSATVAGRALGTPAYMSPEQAEGQLDLLGPASDVYSLGATLYCLLTGHAPVEGRDEVAVLARVAAGEVPPPRSRNPRVPRGLEAVCLKAMALRPAARYASARDLAAEIERWLADEPVTAAPETTSQRLARWTRRHRAFVQSGALALVAMLLLSAGFLAALNRAYRGERLGRLQALNAKLRADDARKRAETAEGVALEQKGRAEQARVQAELARAEVSRKNRELVRRAALLLLNRGLAECDAGRANRGILWLAQALKSTPTEEVALAHAIQANLASWYRRVPSLRQQLAHGGHRIIEASFSPDGRQVLVGTDDGSAQLWETATGKPIGMPVKLRGWVPFARFRSDGRLAVTAAFTPGAGGSFQIIDTSTGRTVLSPAVPLLAQIVSAWFLPDSRTLLVLTSDGDGLRFDYQIKRFVPQAFAFASRLGRISVSPNGKTAVAPAPDGKTVLASYGKVAQLWDATTGEPRGAPLAHDQLIAAVAFSPDGRTVATVCFDSKVRLWSVATGKLVGAPLEHAELVHAVAFSPDGQAVLTGSQDRTARLWDATTGKPLTAPLEHQGAVHAVAFSPDGRTVLTGGNNNMARLWDAASGQAIATPLEHGREVRAVAFSPDGRAALTGSYDGTTRLWDIAGAVASVPPLQHEGPVYAVAFNGDGALAATGGQDGARLWKTATWEPIGALIETRGAPGVLSLVFSPDGKTLLTHTLGAVQLWEVATGTEVGPALESQTGFRPAAFSSSGHAILTVAMDGTAHLEDPATRRIVLAKLAHQSAITGVAYSPDRRMVLTVSADKTARLWDVATGNLLRAFVDHAAVIEAVAFSPSGKVAATGSNDQTARLWDTATAKAIALPLRHKGSILKLAFSPDGTKVVTGSFDGTARVWEVATGKPITPPLAHTGPVQPVAFSPDGRMVLSGSFDGTARLWDIATGNPIGPRVDHSGVVVAAAFSPDGQWALTGSADRTARVWDLRGFDAPPDNPQRMGFIVQAMTGLRLDEDGVIRDLDLPTWESARAQAISSKLLNRALAELSPTSRVVWYESQFRAAAERGHFFAARWHLDCIASLGPSTRETVSRGFRDLLDRELRRLDDRRSETRTDVRDDLVAWRSDPALTALRDDPALAQLPKAEGDAWRDFWVRVDGILADLGLPVDPFAR
jgi:WD40 repeat protein/serine/threonine protein kinase